MAGTSICTTPPAKQAEGTWQWRTNTPASRACYWDAKVGLALSTDRLDSHFVDGRERNCKDGAEAHQNLPERHLCMTRGKGTGQGRSKSAD